ncbi:hypothetical protein ROZALSC1DRAFT_23259 [Rozella allomycis CSF55]|uniref:Uncharacterized protein n=1 Tax=Rozella allomycis (strain CSF55) TaxID=988480 RepID=A0A4V1IZK9_ROZAC|nr:hypothetical protein ROZALSC1DRAFT_23259 [Rozella allomycis CSF55]
MSPVSEFKLSAPYGHFVTHSMEKDKLNSGVTTRNLTIICKLSSKVNFHAWKTLITFYPKSYNLCDTLLSLPNDNDLILHCRTNHAKDLGCNKLDSYQPKELKKKVTVSNFKCESLKWSGEITDGAGKCKTIGFLSVVRGMMISSNNMELTQ